MDKVRLNTNIRDILSKDTNSSFIDPNDDINQIEVNQLRPMEGQIPQLTSEQLTQLRQLQQIQQMQQLQQLQLQQLQQSQQKDAINKSETVVAKKIKKLKDDSEIDAEVDEVVDQANDDTDKKKKLKDISKIMNECKTPAILFILFICLTSQPYMNFIASQFPRLAQVGEETNMLGMLLKAMVFVAAFAAIKRYI
jgi:TolA-binding protein